MTEHDWWSRNWNTAFPEGVRLSVVVPVYNERYLVGESLRRLLAVNLPAVARLEIVAVDDGSTDGSAEIVAALAAEHPETVRFLRRERNGGKGAALRDGIEAATGDLIVFQDADLEYDPRDLSRLIRPFLEDGADVVYGSRYAASPRRRVLNFRHSMGNRLITWFSNLLTDLDLTDVETCYKMFRGPLLQSIPIRSDDFGIEIELTAKAAKRHCSIYEVPISYRGRSYREGKKIGLRDAWRAVWTMLRFWAIDDIYKENALGERMLHSPDRTRRFNVWMADTLRPWVGDRVLELRAGTGHLTMSLIPRDEYVASDDSAAYLHYLQNLAAGKPYLAVERIDLERAETLRPYAGRFDTVVAVNVLEQSAAPERLLGGARSVLADGGRLLLYVPRGPALHSPLDDAQGHRRRYLADELAAQLEAAGFTVESLRDFNRVSVLGWWWNGKLLRRKVYPRFQLKIFDLLVPLLRRIDRLLPWRGLGLLAVARKSA